MHEAEQCRWRDLAEHVDDRQPVIDHRCRCDAFVGDERQARLRALCLDQAADQLEACRPDRGSGKAGLAQRLERQSARVDRDEIVAAMKEQRMGITPRIEGLAIPAVSFK